MLTEDITFNVLKHDLARYLPIRIVLRKNSDGILEGLCEDSFSMSFSGNCVRIWWSGKAYSVIGEHILNGIEDAEHNAKDGDLILDPLSDDCPVIIDWDRWIKASDKYGKRNAYFVIKEVVK